MSPETRAQKNLGRWLNGQAARAISKTTELVFGVKPNGLLELAIDDLSDVVRSATKSVKIVSGSLNPLFYTDERFLDALRHAIGKNKVQVLMLSGPDADRGSIEKLQQLNSEAYGRINLYEYPVRPTHHFMVVDGKHIRVELTHAPGRGQRHAYAMRDAPENAAKLEEKFDQFLERAEQIA